MSIKNKQQLIKEICDGENFKYHPFLKGPFSNWKLAEFMIDDILYKHTEQYYMAQKAKFFNDLESYEKIMKIDDPKVIKRIGRNENIKNFDINIWNKVKYEIMLKGNFAKYSQNLDFAKKLLKTKNQILIECNPKDLEWSCGLSIEDDDVKNPFKWPGKNLLGFVLIEVRDLLKH